MILLSPGLLAEYTCKFLLPLILRNVRFLSKWFLGFESGGMTRGRFPARGQGEAALAVRAIGCFGASAGRRIDDGGR